MFKKILAAFAVLCFIMPCSLFAAQAPEGLKPIFLSTNDTSTWLCWDRPVKGDDAVFYNIYQDGAKIGSTKDVINTFGTKAMKKFQDENPELCSDLIIYHSYHVTNLEPEHEYSFSVKAVNKNGEESPESNICKIKTTATPEVIDAENFGAVGDGKTLNTEALQKAIDAVPENGVLRISDGIFLSGALYLKSNMTLLIEKNATLLATDDPNAYKMLNSGIYTKGRYNGLLNGVNIKNLRIVGEGTIDGNGWLKDKEGYYRKAASKTREEDVRNGGILAKTQTLYLMEKEGREFKKAYNGRGSTLTLDRVDNLYIEGLTMQNPSLHMIVIVGDNVAVNNVNFLTYDANNGDAIDYTGKNYTVTNCYIDSGDDSVNFNAGIGEEAVGMLPVGDAWIFNNYTRHAHGGVTLGSHTASWIENILGEDNIYELTEIPFRCKTSETTGGGGRNVIFRHNVMKDIPINAFLFTTNYTDIYAVGEFKETNAGVFHDILVEDCNVLNTKKAAFKVEGMPNAKHYNITLRNVNIRGGVKEEINNGENILQENVIYN